MNHCQSIALASRNEALLAPALVNGVGVVHSDHVIEVIIMKIISTVLIIAVAITAPAFAASHDKDSIVRAYMLCVRTTAERLEPSGDAPEDIAKASIFVCQSEEAKAFSADPAGAENLRDTAIFYGAGQAVIARLCRKTGDCGVAPVPK